MRACLSFWRFTQDVVDRDSSRRVKRRRPGRANKYLGDLALMSASPLDAREYYVRAMEACRDGDKLWYDACGISRPFQTMHD